MSTESCCRSTAAGSRAEAQRRRNGMARLGDPFAFDGTTAWEPAGDGVRRKVLCYDKGVMMVRVVFTAGAVGARSIRIRTCNAASSKAASSTSPSPAAPNACAPATAFWSKANALHGAVAVEAGTLARRVRADAGGVCGVGANGEWRRAPFASPRLRGEGSACGRTSGAKGSGGEGTVQKEAPGRSRSASFVAAPSPSPASQACRLRRPSPRKRGEAKGALFNYPFAIRAHSLTPA